MQNKQNIMGLIFKIFALLKTGSNMYAHKRQNFREGARDLHFSRQGVQTFFVCVCIKMQI